ncbi:LysR family transcriptional regulator [Roseovarius sp. C03]|uniref:LysR family transcriptional regulator n=1 Tax=Roseovarius sp. C03 TaxID=3449222 RepID=UPI003EDBB8CA
MQKRMDGDFDWTRLRAFLATAEAGSLSAAARRLGLTQPTLGRQVSALEQELGLALFERAGRTLHLTDAGHDVLAEARGMGEAATRIALIAQGRARSLEGRIKLTASDMMSAHVLPDILLQLRPLAPKLRVDIIAANDIRDILAREADIAIRHVRPSEPDLIARLVGDAPAHFYGSRDYLATRGTPHTPDDLATHDIISFGDDARMIEALAAWGLPLSPHQFTTGATSGIACWELARKGFGLAPMSDDIAAGFPDMVPLLTEGPKITFPVWLVTHRDLHTSRRIRLVFDLLAEMLSEGLT